MADQEYTEAKGGFQDFTSDNFNTENVNNNNNSTDYGNNFQEAENNISNGDNYENNDSANNRDNYEEDEGDRLEPEQYRKLFIGSLNYITSEETMRSYFGKFGDIVDCVIMKEPKTSKYVDIFVLILVFLYQLCYLDLEDLVL